MPRFGSFQGRILFFFLGLFILVQVLAFLAVNRAGRENARAQIKDELMAGGRVFDRLVKARTERLSEAARILSGDFAFKTAFSDGDRPTLVSAMRNHAARINADVMQLVSVDHILMADTLRPKASLRKFPFPELIKTAEQSGEASALVFLGDRYYQIVVVPLLAPVPVAWICMGFAIDDALALEFQQLNFLDVTFVQERGGYPPAILASTLSNERRRELIASMQSVSWDSDMIAAADMGGEQYVSLSRNIGGQGDSLVRVFLQRSMEKALQPFYRLRGILIMLFTGGLLITLIGSVLVSATVTRPVRMLEESARRIEQGDYSRTVPIGRKDELGKLSSAFNHMAEAIAQREERITFQAYHDILTGMPNRVYLYARLGEAVEDARSKHQPFALVIMDISRFKTVNAVLGHATADIILRKIGPLLRGVVKEPAAVARMGGDEFAVLLSLGEDTDSAVRVVQTISKALEAPILIDGNPIQIEASFGIAVFPLHGENADALMRHADVAMHLAKTSPGGISVYSPEQDHYSLRQLTLLGELRHAIESEEMVMYYQPKVDFPSGRITATEALLRWRHPQHGFISPDDFIPLLEGTGLIKPLTVWTLNAAIEQCARLNQQGTSLGMSVNLSARMLLDRQIPDRISSLLETHKVLPGQITLEVTESAIMTDPERTMQTITRLDELGILLSIDDFGTGYSSLAYLQKLPVDELKIDKSFVQHMDTSMNDVTIVRSTIALAHNLQMKVTAEGVETQRIWDMLKSHGCDLAQGYLMSKPIPAEELMRWIKESRWGLEHKA